LIPADIQTAIFEGILFLYIMPSMRAMMTAGPALERDNAAAYNCAYAPVDRISTHDEAFYLTMCSVGVGFSVERQYTNQMPNLPDELVETPDNVLVVEDDKIGWCQSFHQMIEELYLGRIPRWDVSKVRKKGTRLMTFGGRASGPDPLVDLFEHTISIFREAVAEDLKRLTSYFKPFRRTNARCEVGRVVEQKAAFPAGKQFGSMDRYAKCNAIR
jgi:ribonucleoside-diphosphate reductase alpha chain